MITNKKWFHFVVICLLVFCCVFIGCDEAVPGSGDDITSDGSKIPEKITQLTANTYSDGAVIEDGDQWFDFTSTASTQYLWVIYGTMNNMDVQLYTSSGDALGNALHLRSGQSNYVSLTVSSGQPYYVKVTPGTDYQYNSSDSGTFRMTYNTVPFAPGTFDKAAALSSGVWASGNILDSGEQWFKFTAGASTQYVHVIFGTMENMDVQLYTDTANALGNALHLRSRGSNYASLIVASGQTYYIRITGGTDYQYLASESGTYRIAFNTSETAPAAN